MQILFSEFMQVVGSQLPNLLGAAAILILGWLVALAIAGLIRGMINKAQIYNKSMKSFLGDEVPKVEEPGKWVAKGVYYFLMLLVLVSFFQALGLTIATEPLNHILIQISDYAPRLLSAILLLLLSWILARTLKSAVSLLLKVAKADERLGDSVGKKASISETVGNAAYWLIFLLFLPAILDALALEGLLYPVQKMLGEVLGFLPNLVASGLILLVGLFAARVVQRIVANVLAAAGVDRVSEEVGLKTALGRHAVSGVIGLVIYALILIPVVIAALDALQIRSISDPASQMLSTIFNAFPSIFTAVLVVLLAYLAGRFVTRLVSDLLTRAGFNRLFARLGLGEEESKGKQTPAQVAGYLALVVILLFATIEAARLLGFHALAGLLVQFITFIGQVILGLTIFGVGLYLSQLAYKVIHERDAAQGIFLAMAARISILILGAAMALRQMGVANEIINIAFTLLLGAIAVAVALSFGLGARDAAAKQVEKWVESLNKGSK